ncbi:MAG: hypothetical protein U9Q39_02095, partial [Pseudomonadota bacterium]|nr:hypothetical protein [Pseudomonadota bacterium]
AGRIKEAQKSYLRLSYLFPQQKKVVVDALLAAARLAKAEGNGPTARKIIEKLKSLTLTEPQERKLKKLVAQNVR